MALRRSRTVDFGHGEPGVAADTAALLRYAESGIRSVDGWLGGDATWTIAELARQQVALGERGAVAEIGVHHGQLFLLMALTSAEDETCVGIDLFEEQNQNLDGSGLGDRQILESNIDFHGADRSRIELVTANSQDLTAADVMSVAGGRVRMFSVDGGHSSELTENDLLIASQSITDSGIVILDDVFSPMWPGVMTGLVNFLQNKRSDLIPFGLAGNKTLLCRPHSAERWLHALEPAGEFFQTRVDVLFGSMVRVLLDSPETANAWKPEGMPAPFIDPAAARRPLIDRLPTLPRFEPPRIPTVALRSPWA